MRRRERKEKKGRSNTGKGTTVISKYRMTKKRRKDK